jgi:hypothetical protein
VDGRGDEVEQAATPVRGVHRHVQAHSGKERSLEPGHLKLQQPAVVLGDEAVTVPRPHRDEGKTGLEPAEERLHLGLRAIEAGREQLGPRGQVRGGQRPNLRHDGSMRRRTVPASADLPA